MRIGFLITARLKSSRLPLKLLLDINGKTIVERVIERTKLVSNIDTVILCTSLNKQDKPLVDIALKNNIYYFLGDELDVVKRLRDAADFFDVDYIINITGENPLFSIYHANLLIDKIRKESPDFAYIEGLPIGCAVYGIKTNALSLVCEIKKEIDTEIWGVLINQPEYFKISKIIADSKFDNVRITSDYKEDYLFIKTLYSFYNSNDIPDFFSIEEILKQNPELLEINKKHKQIGLSQEKIDEVANHYNKNKSKIIKLKAKYKLD